MLVLAKNVAVLTSTICYPFWYRQQLPNKPQEILIRVVPLNKDFFLSKYSCISPFFLNISVSKQIVTVLSIVYYRLLLG